ncbi:MAG: tetratricopeptide repeat protein, partial [Myxococcales bacterium]
LLQVAAGVALVLSLGGGAWAAVAYLAAPETETDTVTESESVAESESVTESVAGPESETESETEIGLEPEEEVEASPVRPAPVAAGELLERANHARAAGEYGRAERLYSRAMRRAADPDDAYVATVAAAGLRLEHTGSPRGALALYRRALRARPTGPLSASVRHGIAEAHRALGDREAEAQALRELVARHPGHLLTPRAEARLRALASPSASAE